MKKLSVIAIAVSAALLVCFTPATMAHGKHKPTKWEYTVIAKKGKHRLLAQHGHTMPAPGESVLTVAPPDMPEDGSGTYPRAGNPCNVPGWTSPCLHNCRLKICVCAWIWPYGYIWVPWYTEE